jgi:hypothetical protein
MSRWKPALVAALLAVSCNLPAPPPAPPLPPGCFAFGVFGDGPYRVWEEGRFRYVIKDVNRSDVQWLIHVGDIFWYPCSDAHYKERLAAMNSVECPVIYTPGDNEWTDCHTAIAGGYKPLERLQELRSIFFAHPGRSLGARTMAVETQAEDPAFAPFVENVRWVRGGFVFATVHMVGSENAGEDFAGRGPEDDAARVRRTQAAIAWMADAFRIAHRDHLHGVVVAMHAETGIGDYGGPDSTYAEFVDSLDSYTRHFSGSVLLIHGDSHLYRVDHPLRDAATKVPLPNFTRLETFGSPEIGWVRVVVDSVAGKVIAYQPRRMRNWWLW